MPLKIILGCTKVFNNVASNLNELVIKEVEGELDTVRDSITVLEIADVSYFELKSHRRLYLDVKYLTT